MDRRVVPSLVAGLGGLAAGVAGSITQTRELSLLAGAASFTAAWACLPAVRNLLRTEREVAAPAVPADLVDRATGLPDDRYFVLAIEGRVRTARRRLWPLAVCLVELDFRREGNGSAESGDLAAASSVLVREAREADDVCRLGPGLFGLLLDDSGEPEATAAITRLQAALDSEVASTRLAAGIAVYPSHGLSGPDVHQQARAALEQARTSGSGALRVQVARLESA